MLNITIAEPRPLALAEPVTLEVQLTLADFLTIKKGMHPMYQFDRADTADEVAFKQVVTRVKFLAMGGDAQDHDATETFDGFN